MQHVHAGNAAIPAIGFGTYGMTGDDIYRMIPEALRAGFRHIDTGQIYRNEAEIGDCVAASGIRHPKKRPISDHQGLGQQLLREILRCVRQRKPTQAQDGLHRPPPAALARGDGYVARSTWCANRSVAHAMNTQRRRLMCVPKARRHQSQCMNARFNRERPGRRAQLLRATESHEEPSY